MLYADYNGSAPILDCVSQYLRDRLSEAKYSNPNATHQLGKNTLFKIEKSRRVLARTLGCRPHQITFNSGSSEGISHIFHSILERENHKKIIIISEIEHMAIVQACQFYQARGFKIMTIKTLPSGQVDLNHLAELLQQNSQQIALVSVIAANNETGVIQPYRTIGEQCQKHGALFFSDTTQYIGKTDFQFEQSHMDFAVCSSHKIGALIGSGFIISRKPELLQNFIFGGGQESGLRGGTQNYLAIETMEVAIEYFQQNIAQLNRVRELREKFEARLQQNFPKLHIIGKEAPRLASTTMLSYPGLAGHLVQAILETEEIYVTTSSACSDGKAGNRILRAMQLAPDVCAGAVRISLCLNTDQAVYDQIEVATTDAYNKLKNMYHL